MLDKESSIHRKALPPPSNASFIEFSNHLVNFLSPAFLKAKKLFAGTTFPFAINADAIKKPRFLINS